MASLKADNERLQKMNGKSPATSPGSGNESSSGMDNRLSLGDPSSLGKYHSAKKYPPGEHHANHF